MTRIIRGPRPAVERPLRPQTRVIRRIEQQAARRAQALIDAARAEAVALTTAAELEAEAASQASRDDAAAEAARLVAIGHRQRRALVEQARGQLTELALRIAEKIIARQLSIEPETVTAIVERCIRAAGARRQLELRVSPHDLATLEARRDELRRWANGAELALTADPQITRGGCVIATESGEVDGRLEHQLEAIRRALTEAER